VYISHMESSGAEQARLKVEALCEEVKVGRVYEGRVTSIKDFGAFIEILPGRDGLCHISELDDKYVDRVDSVVKVGDRLQVKVIAIDDQDRVKLSRKALLRDQGKTGAEGSPRREGGEGGGRREGAEGGGRREGSEGGGRRDGGEGGGRRDGGG